MTPIFRFVLPLATAAVMFASSVHAQSRFVSLGHVDLSFYEVTASLVQQVLERLGHNVAIHKGSHSEIYPMLGSGKIDLFVAAWLPNAHAEYWKEYEDQTEKVTALYEDARLFWSVPDYVPASAVSSVEDLRKPEVAEKMQKIIRGTRADSGLMMGSKKIFDAYALAEAGYALTPGKVADWVANFNDNIAAQRWFVMPLWQPQYLNKVQKMRILAEPKKIFGGADTAWLVARKELRGNLSKHAFGALQRMSLSVKAITELDYLVNVRNVPPREAARNWMAAHADTVSYWLEGESE